MQRAIVQDNSCPRHFPAGNGSTPLCARYDCNPLTRSSVVKRRAVMRHTAPFRIEPLDRRILLAATPVLVKETSIGTWGSDPWNYEDVGGTVFFVASDNSFAHDELWKTDGTPAGTVRVKDFGARSWLGVELG